MVGLQGSLFGTEAPRVDPVMPIERRDLSTGSWVDVGRAWLRGGDSLLDELRVSMPWRQGRRRMYERMLADPRLSCSYRPADTSVPAIDAIADDLAGRYGVTLRGVFLNYYRDGQDSVAFHADRELHQLDNTVVAIVTLGAARPFLLRPKGGGRSVDLRPASGDLLVMGGRCQLDWQHGIPKVAHCGPRISLSLRWAATA